MRGGGGGSTGNAAGPVRTGEVAEAERLTPGEAGEPRTHINLPASVQPAAAIASGRNGACTTRTPPGAPARSRPRSSPWTGLPPRARPRPDRRTPPPVDDRGLP